MTFEDCTPSFFGLIHLDLAPRNCRSAATVRVTRHHRYLIVFCREIPMEVSQNGVPPNHPKLDHDVSMETHGDLGIHHDLRTLPMAFGGTFTGKPFLFTSCGVSCIFFYHPFLGIPMMLLIGGSSII
jgi:hypothetical protein